MYLANVGGGPGFEGAWFGPLMFLVWGLFIAGIVWLVLAVSRRRDDARVRRILDERFASGELSAEEYEKRRRILG